MNAGSKGKCMRYLEGSYSRGRTGLCGEGPVAVVTNKCMFRFDEVTKEMYLGAPHPAITIEDIKREVQWSLKVAPNLKTTEPMYMYGMRPSVYRVQLAFYRAERKIAEALGMKMVKYSDEQFFWKGSVMGIKY